MVKVVFLPYTCRELNVYVLWGLLMVKEED